MIYQDLMDIFELHNGVNILKRELQTQPTPDTIQVVGASGSLDATIIGYVNKTKVNKIFEKNSLYVSTNGAGCCTSFISPIEFAANADVCVLIPKISLTLQEKIYYSCVINANKYKFSYGRKPKGERLGTIKVPAPSEIPSWVYEIDMPTFNDISEAKNQDKVELPSIDQWKDFKYPEIFNLSIGKACGVNEAKKTPGTNQLIGSSSIDNGVVAYTGLSPTEKANTLTIAKDGSVGSCFYHTQPYLATSHVIVAELKNHILTPQIAMFVIPFITQTGKMFNFGRAWGLNRMKESVISLPVTEQDEPDWDLMERYINGLPYSKYL